MNLEQTARSGRRFAVAGRKTWLTLACFCFALSSRASDPAWWSSGGAVVAASTPNPNAVANQGQLKQFTVAAVNEMNADLPGGAGDALNGLVAGWQQDYATNNYTNDPNNPSRPYKPADFQAVNLGQLKYIASLIYAQLQQAGYTATIPSWITTNRSTGNTVAVLGQLKTVFNFDLSLDSDGSGLPIWWEKEYFHATGVNASALAANNTGLTILQSYQQGLNPNDFYNSSAPTLTYLSGSAQLGPPGGFVPAPLIVSVADASGNPLVNAPVTFSVASGGGQVQRSSNSAPGPSITVLTGFNGQVQVFFQLPNVPSNTSQIVAVPGSGSYAGSVPFTESSDGGGGTFGSPFDPSNVVATVNSDGSGDVSWTNNADPSDTESIDIMYKDRNGTWQVLSNVPAGTTSYHIPAP